MHTLTIRGTSGPVHRAVMRLLGRWNDTIRGYDGLPEFLQVLNTPRGVRVTTSCRALANYLHQSFDETLVP